MKLNNTIIGMIIFAAIMFNVEAQSKQTYVITTKNTIIAADSTLNSCSFGDVGCYIDNTIIRIGDMISAIVNLPMNIINGVIDRFKNLVAWHNNSDVPTIVKIFWLPFDIVVWILKNISLLFTNPLQSFKNLWQLITVFIALVGTPFIIIFLFLESFILVKILITSQRNLTIYRMVEGELSGHLFYLNMISQTLFGIWRAIKPGGT